MSRLINLLALAATAVAQTSFYVSTTGSDSNPGTQAQPFATPQRAASAVSGLSRPLSGAVSVFVAPGMYYLANPLTIDPTSGGDASAVTWSATGPGAVLSGGAPVTGWTAVSGFTDVYTATLPKATWPQTFVRQLFTTDGQRRLLTSTPVMQYASYDFNAGQVVMQPGQVSASPAAMAEAQIRLWQCWTSTENYIASYTPGNNTIYVQGVAGGNWLGASGNRYAVMNIADPSQLAPGTFYFSPSTRAITYRAMPGENPATGGTILIAPRLATVLSVTGNSSTLVQNVAFTGLTFAHTTANLEEQCISDGCGDQSGSGLAGTAVWFTGVSGVSFTGNEVTLTGQYAVWAAASCTNVTIAGNYIHNLGAGGVRVGVGASGTDPTPDTLAQYITVSDNVICDSGYTVQAGTGVLLQQAANSAIVHNHIHHLLYTGISTGWSWGYAATSNANLNVSYNLIHDIAQGVLSDLACIYNLGRSPGTVFDHNVCHDVLSYGYGGWGTYTDEGSSNVTFSNNIAFLTKSASHHQHYGTDNLFVNNVYAFPGLQPCGDAGGCDNAALRSSQHGAGGGEGVNSSFTALRNILLLPPNANYTTLTYTTIPTAFANMTMDYNLYWSYSVPGSNLTFPPTNAPTSWAQWQAGGKDAHGVVADPLFEDPGAYDFSHLDPRSPALALGFVPIDTSAVGPRPGVAGPVTWEAHAAEDAARRERLRDQRLWM